MGSCLSSGYHGKKKVAPAASVSTPAISMKQDLRNEDNLQDLVTRSSVRSPAVEVRQQQLVEDLDPAIWSQLPDDIVRIVLGKLKWSGLMHPQCVSKRWSSWIDDSDAANEFNRQVHPLFIVMYTLILVKDLDDPEP